MNVSFIACDAQYPIVSVSRLRDGGLTTCLGEENYLERTVFEKKHYRKATEFGFVLWKMGIFTWLPIATLVASN